MTWKLLLYCVFRLYCLYSLARTVELYEIEKCAWNCHSVLLLHFRFSLFVSQCVYLHQGLFFDFHFNLQVRNLKFFVFQWVTDHFLLKFQLLVSCNIHHFPLQSFFHNQTLMHQPKLNLIALYFQFKIKTDRILWSFFHRSFLSLAFKSISKLKYFIF